MDASTSLERTASGRSDLHEAADVQAAVDAAAQRVDDMVAADPDLVHGDAVEIVALQSALEVAVPLCRQTMNFVPDTIRERVFEAEHAEAFRRSAALAAERDAAEQKAARRSSRAATTRAATLAAEAAVESARLKSSTCPVCFTVRAASGICGCDE